ncbi:PAS domain S-box-containing protein [Geothermobacter ehrlichii]|uniref:PAS domain S-box-containing protein n=2 Tax=Geothermobacter ehrlichii TaxID=213224 RepID=A0A5D3WGB2_9BACT|nr:PAS domain S-box-containing protein [Geothermobacter ehrlichii]
MRVSREKKLKVTIIEGVLEDAARRVCEEVEKADYEVVVSRGGTAAAIRKVVDIPVVTAEFNDFDLLRALWEAKKQGGKIAYLNSAYRDAYEFEDLMDILGVEVKQYVYRNSVEFNQQIKKAFADNAQVVVSGAEWGQKLANSVGMKGVIIYSSHRTVSQALERAEEVISIRRRDKEYSRRLSTMIQAVGEGVVCIDALGKVLLVNENAENLLGIKCSEVIGKTAAEVNKSFTNLLNLPQGSGQRCSINGMDLVVNRVAVADRKRYFGEVFTMQKVSQLQQLEQKIRKEMHRKGLVARFKFEDIVTQEKLVRDLIEKAKNFAQVDSTVLIIGESGSGKELFAQSIHQASARANGPFVAINCAALPKELLESELFGYEEGAFTGARKGGKPGLFELAHNGTIFLDEIGSISMELQARLLRVLQEREVMRIGGDSVIPVNVRCIAATNENLQQAVKEGNFRHDLYFRLNVLKLTLPPLRKRPKDIPLLAGHFLKIFNQRFGKHVKGVPGDLLAWMNGYSWPGNVRELENFIERMVIMASSRVLDEKWIRQLIAEADEGMIQNDRWVEDRIGVRIGTLEDMERQLIAAVNERVGGNRSDLAKLLGISRTTLWKKLNRNDFD